MNEEYQIKMKRDQFLYYKVFKQQYKNYKRFRNRKRLLFVIFLVYLVFGCLFNWIDAMNTGVWDRSYFKTLLLIFIIGYIIPRFCNYSNMLQSYREYWKLREYLYEENIYIEKIIFSCEGIKILGYDRERKVSDFVTYQNANQMSFYKTGIIFQPIEEEYIYIPRELFRNREDVKQIKKWYEEKNGHGETSI